MAVSSPEDLDDFVALYFQHERKLYRYVASLLSYPSDVEDVLQETAKCLWQTFAQYRREEPFLPWACRIAYHRVLAHCQREGTRRRHFRAVVLEQLADTRREHDELLEARVRWLEKCVEKLGETERRLIQQRYGSEHTLAELAEQTGRTPNAVYMSMWRIRRALFDCVSEGLRAEGWSESGAPR